MADASMDIVSKFDKQEVANAVNAAAKEIHNRYDFKGVGASVELVGEVIKMEANSEDRCKAVLDVVQTWLVKRGVSLKHLDPQKVIPGGKGMFRQLVKIKQGIDRDNARKIIDLLKESKIKVQGSIQEDTVRVTGKNRDDLQAAIKMLRAAEMPIELQYINFRD